MLVKILHPAPLVLLQAVTRPFNLDQAITTRWRETHQVRKAAAIITQVAQDALEYGYPVRVVNTPECKFDEIKICLLYTSPSPRDL